MCFNILPTASQTGPELGSQHLDILPRNVDSNLGIGGFFQNRNWSFIFFFSILILSPLPTCIFSSGSPNTSANASAASNWLGNKSQPQTWETTVFTLTPSRRMLFYHGYKTGISKLDNF